MGQPGRLPWRKPRHEVILLVLVALVALSPVDHPSDQDVSRLCLTQALPHGRLYNDPCLDAAGDVSRYGAHFFSDKAPALAVVELPAAEAVGLPQANEIKDHSLWRLWIVRVLASGLAFLACAFLVGRISEGLAPGYGGAALVAFALGTLVEMFASANFDQVPCATACFASFALAWRRRPLAAGLVAGGAVLIEYQAGLIVALIGAYVAVSGGKAAARYVLGGVPALILLGAYDWAAFGAPWHLSYRYEAYAFRKAEATGFFGIALPHLQASYDVFASAGGVLVLSPIVVAGAWGLASLWTDHRREVALCAAVTIALVALNCGYFLPYGGTPGPRFVIPALPFLALGFGPAFARRPRLTAALAALSVFSMTARTLVRDDSYPGTVWAELVHVPGSLGSSRFVRELVVTPIDWAAPGRVWGACVVAAAALAALVVAFRAMPRAPRASGGLGVALASLCLIASADASAIAGFPYGYATHDISVSIQGSSAVVFPGQEVNFVVTAQDSSLYRGYSRVVVTIALGDGMHLLSAPVVQRGSGCRGTTTLTCTIGDLSPSSTTPIRLNVTLTQVGNWTAISTITAGPSVPAKSASFTVRTIPPP